MMDYFRVAVRFDLFETSNGGLKWPLESPVRALHLAPVGTAEIEEKYPDGFTVLVDVHRGQMEPGDVAVEGVADFMAVDEARAVFVPGSAFSLRMVKRVVGVGVIGEEVRESRVEWLARQGRSSG